MVVVLGFVVVGGLVGGECVVVSGELVVGDE